MSPPVLLGCAKTHLTPPLGTPLAGYPTPGRVAEWVADPLYARVLVFSQGDLRAVLAVMDWVVVQVRERDLIAREIEAATGIPAAQMLIGAIQTHSGPQTQRVWGWGEQNQAYLEESIPKIVAAVEKALGNLEPVSFGVGSGRCDAGVNRREITEDGRVVLGVNPFGAYDSEVILWRFDTERGTKATLVNYGAHPTSRGDDRGISRDWPGVAVDFIEEATGGFAIFVNGVVGDVAPRCTVRSPLGMQEVGTVVGREAMRVFAGICCEREVPLGVLSRELHLPLAPLMPAEEAQARLGEIDREVTWGLEAARRAHYQAVLEEWERGEMQTTRPWLQVLLRLGEAALVPFPGEHFAEIGLRIKQRSPFPYTITASTMNGHEAYFPTREALARGGYEREIAAALGPYMFAEGIDDFLVAENLRLLRELRAS